MRQFVESTIADVPVFIDKLLQWSAQFPYASFLNSNKKEPLKTESENSFDLIAGIDAASVLSSNGSSDFEELKKIHAQVQDWIFGHFSYELKNQTEKLVSENFDGIRFPEMCFFQPTFLFLLKGNILRLGFLTEQTTTEMAKDVLHTILDLDLSKPVSKYASPVIRPRLDKAEYIEKINAIKQHIGRGDIYEMNFCMEFFAEKTKIDPVETYLRLNEISQTPFSAFYKVNDKYLLSASPERFLKKTGTRLLSQPIKGTIRRGASVEEDEQLKKQLIADEKERNENVMIVDLVRNDLSRSAARGSVMVDELYGIYSFRQVHQMISSVSAGLKDGVHYMDAIKNAFPMGSMTGAPKVRAMELIEQYETTRRGIYSGAVGYITPEGDFDFNVVIRSILYNATDAYLSFMVGSAITGGSDPELEYAECLLKAKAMLEVLNADYNTYI